MIGDFIHMAHNVESPFFYHHACHFKKAFCSQTNIATEKLIQTLIEFSESSIDGPILIFGFIEPVEIVNGSNCVIKLFIFEKIIADIGATMDIVNLQPQVQFNLVFIFFFQSIKFLFVVRKIIFEHGPFSKERKWSMR